MTPDHTLVYEAKARSGVNAINFAATVRKVIIPGVINTRRRAGVEL